MLELGQMARWKKVWPPMVFYRQQKADIQRKSRIRDSSNQEIESTNVHKLTQEQIQVVEQAVHSIILGHEEKSIHILVNYS